MNRHCFVVGVTLTTFSILTACGSDSDKDVSTKGGSSSATSSPDSGRAPSGPEKPASELILTCLAEVGRSHIEYTISADILVATVNGERASLPRISTGTGKPVYGMWHIPTTRMSGDPVFIEEHKLRVDATLYVENGRVTSIANCMSKWTSLTASASSPAMITDTAIDILESHHELRQWTPRAGEWTVSVQSVVPFVPSTGFGPNAEAEAPHEVTLAARFPFGSN